MTHPPAAPPVPPPPKVYKDTSQPAQQSSVLNERPPQPPPKPGAPSSSIPTPPIQSSPPNRNAPPLPPLPAELKATFSQSPVSAQGQFQTPPPNFGSLQSIGSGHTAIPRFRSRPQELDSPISPIQPNPNPRQYSTYLPPHLQTRPQYQGPPTGPPLQNAPPASYPQQSPLAAQHPPPQQYIKRPVAPPIDLLTSPLDVTIPSQAGSLDPLPAPPIPPNPEKDALLQAISHAFVAETQRTMESNKAAVSSLLAQQGALRAAYGVLQSEMDQVQSLDATLDNNEHVLRSAMQEADKVIKDAAGRPRPDIDDVLVCPTVVGSQLYSLVADQKACEATRVALVKGLDRGRITLDVFVKQTRSLARDEFLKKALIRKIARGMGLEERPWTA